ncbi:hypothetical protein GH714_021364 [Hevea brasiliensis]|uniref:Arf-GAP domain-containing protein n=1 Tax=Hevea brasiliensis TaxID=3981 RepID=A0A6A6M9C4_HEVBR|nr:hypothetical protein GH714_021364 [Hevea brasiliensis]
MKGMSQVTNLDSWSPEQLRMMSFGGNNRAQAFFKQHGWTDGGKIEAKYTSRAADLYRQILSKEVAKSMAEDAGLPSSPVTSQLAQASNGLADLKINDTPKESSLGRQETSDVSHSLRTSHPVIASSVKKPLGAKKNWEDWRPWCQKAYYKDSGNRRSKEEVLKCKSISSAQYFGDQSKATDVDAQVSLQKFSSSSAISSADLFGNSNDHSIDLAASDLINRISFQAQQDISSLKNMAGETGKKLSSLASTLITDLQDRIL